MKSLLSTCAFTLFCFCFSANLLAQNKKILVDVGHGQKFYSDPADKLSTELVPTERLEYMTGELTKNAATHNAEINYWKGAITSEELSKVNLLFIHVPSIKYSIPFHGARLVDGGVPFAFSNQSDPSSFAVFKEEKGGGKIVAMGEAMVSIYMTSWQDINNYECAPFMEDVIGWLLK